MSLGGVTVMAPIFGHAAMKVAADANRDLMVCMHALVRLLVAQPGSAVSAVSFPQNGKASALSAGARGLRRRYPLLSVPVN